jgi:hypothetical protein
MIALTATPDPLADVRAFRDQLKQEASRDAKRQNLDVLWAVLEEMRLGNARDFSLAEVGRRLEKAGGPKTQSLRNEGGKDFRNLIAVFAAAVGSSGQRLPRGERSQLDIALDTLADPGLRALFKQVVAENRMLKLQNDGLRSAFKALSVSATPIAAMSPAAEVEIMPPRDASGALLPSEIEALRRSIDPDRLAENGWDVQPNGSIVDDTGTTVLPPGFAFAVTKITG